MKLSFKFAAACVALACAPAIQAGPASALYLTYTGVAGYSGIGVVQGGVTSTFAAAYPAGSYEIPIAVDGDVRTTGHFPGGVGGQYTLGGTPTGTSYVNPGFEAYDGTTDGKRNYVVDYSNGNVYATGRDYSNPTLLFNVGAGHLGITYDGTNNSLWIAGWYADTLVANYSLNGALLSSFSTGHSYNGALALDHADQTLWLVDDSSRTLEQYSKSGVLLSTGPFVDYTLGGEFDFGSAKVPEPSSVLLTGTAALLLAVQRRRKARR